MPAAQRGGIEAVIAARRSALPSREELQQRTSDLVQHIRGPRESTPGDITAAEAELAAQQSAGRMSMEGLENALAAIEQGGSPTSSPSRDGGSGPTAREMAAEVSARLSIEAAPLTLLVERASDMMGMERIEGTLIEQLRAVHELVILDFPAADGAGGVAVSSTGDDGRDPGAYDLLSGTYNEAESAASFAEALAEFRGEAEAKPKSERERENLPPLGERLLAKGLVSGCRT